MKALIPGIAAMMVVVISLSCSSQDGCVGLAECADAGRVDDADTGNPSEDGGDGGEWYGTKLPGEACYRLADCVAGVQCLEWDGTLRCYEVCTDTCDVGDCTDTELGFNVCVAPPAAPAPCVGGGRDRDTNDDDGRPGGAS